MLDDNDWMIVYGTQDSNINITQLNMQEWEAVTGQDSWFSVT